MTNAAPKGSLVYIRYYVDFIERETLGWLANEWGGWVYIHHDRSIEVPSSSSGSGKGLLLRSESITEKRLLNKGEQIETGNTISQHMP